MGLVERVSYWFLRENSGGGVEGRERGKAPSRSPVFTSRPLLLFFFFFLFFLFFFFLFFFLFFFFFFFFFFFHARLFAERGAAGEIKRSSVRGAGKEGGSGSLSREISVSLPFLFRSSFVHSFFLSRESLLAKVLLSLLHRRRDVVLLLLQLARSLVLRVNHRLFRPRGGPFGRGLGLLRGVRGLLGGRACHLGGLAAEPGDLVADRLGGLLNLLLKERESELFGEEGEEGEEEEGKGVSFFLRSSSPPLASLSSLSLSLSLSLCLSLSLSPLLAFSVAWEAASFVFSIADLSAERRERGFYFF